MTCPACGSDEISILLVSLPELTDPKVSAGTARLCRRCYAEFPEAERHSGRASDTGVESPE